MVQYKIGIDIGSTTAKVVVLRAGDGGLVFQRYERHQAKVRECLTGFFSAIAGVVGNEPVEVNITGSVGMGVCERCGIPFVQEVVAASNYVRHAHPEVSTMIDIGGEDAKVVFFEEQRATDLRMNGNCAGGTGAFIDQMALLKMNILHWHLTDDVGWRMEIKKYPLLTAMSAWRVPLASGEWNWQEVKLAIQENDPEATYGGFYTQEQMKEIIAYARSRRVTVVPEIELPGHAYAAMHAYGELVCDGVNFPVEGKKGRDTVCMGRPETLRFVKDVVDELKTIFPPGSPIHLGHDEVSTESWRNCKYCQSRLKELNENSLKALGRDFLQQVASYVRQGGYDAIVWDEGGELEADKHIFVMAWRGNDVAAAAARKGHSVILSPSSHFYFDYYQSASAAEPKAIGGLIPLRQVYGYELPELAPEEARKVRGLQANIWTEYLYDMGLVEYMAWPRALALAERAWSDCDPRDYQSFRSRAALALKLLEKLAVKYRPMDEEDG